MKVKLRILNIFYLIFSTVAIAVYVMSPTFSQVTFDYIINEDVLMDQDIDDEAFAELGFSISDIFSDLNDNEFVFSFTANIDYQTMLNAWIVPSSYYEDDDRESLEIFMEDYVLLPAFQNSFSDDEDDEETQLEDALDTIAYSCMKAMFYNTTIDNLGRASLNPWGDLADAGYTREQMRISADIVTNKTLNAAGEFTQIMNYYKEECGKYIEAVTSRADPNSGAKSYDETMTYIERDLNFYLINLGFIQRTATENGFIYAVTSSYEVSGTIFQRLIDHEDFEEGESELVVYVDEENDALAEYSPFTQVFVNVIKNSNYNEDNQAFIAITLLIRLMGILFVLFVLMWVIKIIQFIACCFKSKPYIKLNPVGIVVGAAELLLAGLHIGSMILYNNDYLSQLRLLPYVGDVINAVLPIGFSVELLFASLLPGLMVLANFLFSIVYGPVKSKFKKDAREEILYSEEQYDFE